MNINEINNPYEFYDLLLTKFNKFPGTCAFIQGLAYSLCNDPSQYKQEPLLAFLEENGKDKIAIFMTEPWPIVLYSEKNVSETEIEFICDFLIEKKLKIPAINAPITLSELFSEIWCKKNHCSKEKNIEMILYCLEEIKSIESTTGFLQIADSSMKNILIEWSEKFNQDLRLHMEKSYIEHHVDFVIKNKHAFVWIDNKVPVSMTFYERPFDQGVFIGYVYTPPQYRRKGYATNCVYQVSKNYLEKKYSFCSLFTDKKNPTTNDIYQRIGYQPITEYVNYNFLYDK